MTTFFATLLLTAAVRNSARPPVDACTVFTKSEIAAVQGETFTSTKLSTRANKATACFYQLPTFAKSVSVDLMRSGGRAFWDAHFEGEDERREGEEENEHVAPPVKVRGVGNEAVWITSKVAGSLFVRKGDALLRVSVGGPGSDDDRLERSKRLARAALKRM